MGGGDRNDHGNVANVKLSDSVMHGDALGLPAMYHLIGDRRHFLDRHGDVALKFEGLHGLSGGLVAHRTDKYVDPTAVVRSYGLVAFAHL